MAKMWSISAEDALFISTRSAEFGYLVDRGRATECAKLFTPEAKLIFNPGSPKLARFEGFDAIKSFLAGRQAQTHVTTRHAATNFRFTEAEAGRVRCHSLLTIYRSEDEGREPSISAVCDIDEVYGRAADGEWMIEERLTTPVFTKG